MNLESVLIIVSIRFFVIYKDITSVISKFLPPFCSQQRDREARGCLFVCYLFV